MTIHIRSYKDGDLLPRGKVVWLRFVVKRDEGWRLLLRPHDDLVQRPEGLEVEDSDSLWVREAKP